MVPKLTSALMLILLRLLLLILCMCALIAISAPPPPIALHPSHPNLGHLSGDTSDFRRPSIALPSSFALPHTHRHTALARPCSPSMSASNVAPADPALAASGQHVEECFTSPLWTAVSSCDCAAAAAASLVSAGARLHSLEWGSLVEEGNVAGLSTALKAGARPSAAEMGSLLIDAARFNPQGLFQPAEAMALTDALLRAAEESGSSYCADVVSSGGRQAAACATEAARSEPTEVVQRITTVIAAHGN